MQKKLYNMVIIDTSFSASMLGYVTFSVTMQCNTQREADDILRAIQLMSSHSTGPSSSPIVERTRSGEIRPATPTETQIINRANPIRSRFNERVERTIDDGVVDLNDSAPTEYIDRPVRAAFVFNESGEMVGGSRSDINNQTTNNQTTNNINESKIKENEEPALNNTNNTNDVDHNYQTDIDL